METQCIQEQMVFQQLGRREVVGRFDGGMISSDAGGLLLREVEKRFGILKRFAACFRDYRDSQRIEHSLETLISQRVYGIALGYEDLNDHDRLRHDVVMGVLCEKNDPSGMERARKRDQGKAVAGKSTLNRLELTPENANEKSRYKKIVAHGEQIEDLIVNAYIETESTAPQQVVLDVDATDDIIYGNQEGRFFHGYYGDYCYLPLYIFCGEYLLCARLRVASEDPASGVRQELERIVKKLRTAWPQVRIIVRGDSGFCRDEIMSYCEQHEKVDYVLGLAKNSRLNQQIEAEMAQAQQLQQESGQAARVFKDFRYRTRKSWSCERRVVGKAEYLAKGENPRFIVTSISSEEKDARTLYEDFYCARGDMENRIKEQQLGLFADRTSTAWMRSNQLRLYFSSFAYILMQRLRRLGLEGTELAQAQCDTIRLKLFKIGAQIEVTVRKVWISFSESYPYLGLFQRVFTRLQQIPSGG
ncbi:MAG TPA: IS1380 family transposase [Terrimicrobiaceae bacterium]